MSSRKIAGSDNDGVFLTDRETEAFGNELRTVLALLAVFAVFHLHELTNFTLSIDDEYAAFRDNAAVWLGQGRWSTYLFEKYVLPQPVRPFLPLALFGLFCAIGYRLFLRALGHRRSLSFLSVAAFPLFVSFPTWSYLTAFQSNTPTAGLGVLFGCLSVLLFRKSREQFSPTRWRSWAQMALAALSAAAAIGCYQSFVLFIAVVLLASVIAMGLAGRPMHLIWRDCIAAGILLVVALVIYGLILKLFMSFTQADTSYIQGFVRLDRLRAAPRQVLQEAFVQFKSVYLGRSIVYGHTTPAFVLLLIASAASLVYKAGKRAGTGGAFLAALGVLILVCVPFGMNPMSGGSMPLRSLVAVPVAITGLFLLGVRDGPRWLVRAGIAILLLAYLSIFKTSSEFNAARDLVQTHDRQLALALSERIAAIAGSNEPGKRIKLDIFGFKTFQSPYPRNNESTIGASFFEWDRGNPSRIVTYMKLIGLPSYDIASAQLRRKYLDDFVGMPPWPASGAVRTAADGTILVKLSDIPNPNYRDLLVGNDPEAKPGDAIFYKLSGAPEKSWAVQNASARKTSDGIALDSRFDPQFIFSTGDVKAVRDCSRIELRARLRLTVPSVVQVFYRKMGQSDFDGDSSIETAVQPAPDGGFVEVSLQMISRRGFVDSFRLDPGDDPQQVTLGETELFCRHARTGTGP